jgi:hypothetical protein
MLLGSGRASASELHRAERLEAPPEPERRYYGWQNIAVGYSGALLMVHGWSSESPMLVAVGAATYGFGGMVVHGAHGNGTAAALSPLIMLGVPLVSVIAADNGNDEILAPIAVLWMLGAPAIDGVLGREPVPSAPKVSIAPALRRDHVGLSFTGAF